MDEYERLRDNDKERIKIDIDKLVKNATYLLNGIKMLNESMPAFYCSIYNCFSISYTELKNIANPEDLKRNIQYFYETPDEFDAEFIQMVAHGFTIKESYELLKETYQF